MENVRQIIAKNNFPGIFQQTENFSENLPSSCHGNTFVRVTSKTKEHRGGRTRGTSQPGHLITNPAWSVKPIFHQNAKSFALDTFASPNAKDSTFALPQARNTNMLVSFALGDANFLRWPCTFLFFGVYFICVG